MAYHLETNSFWRFPPATREKKKSNIRVTICSMIWPSSVDQDLHLSYSDCRLCPRSLSDMANHLPHFIKGHLFYSHSFGRERLLGNQNCCSTNILRSAVPKRRLEWPNCFFYTAYYYQCHSTIRNKSCHMNLAWVVLNAPPLVSRMHRLLRLTREAHKRPYPKDSKH